MFSKFSTKFSACCEPFATSLGLSCTESSKQKSVLYTKYFSTSAPKIEAVPDLISLAPDRCYIKLLDGWAVPIQLTRSEALRLLPLLAECDRESALRILESALPPVMEGAE